MNDAPVRPVTAARPSAPWLIALGAALALAASAAHAGRRCDSVRPTPQIIERGMGLAQRTASALEQAYTQDGTRVVLLARAGQDLTKYGQTWSHVGWAYRTAGGDWRVVHKLNHCGSDQSVVMRQGLGEFFLDDLWRYQASWRAAPRAWQDALWQLLQDNRRALTRLGGRITAGNVAFDDHPDAQRFANRIETVTADSVLAWLDRLGAAGTGGRQAPAGLIRL